MSQSYTKELYVHILFYAASISLCDQRTMEIISDILLDENTYIRSDRRW